MFRMVRLCVTALAFILGAGLFAPVLAGEKVNVNTADALVIAHSLTGIGESRAEAIVAYREQYGPYKTLSEITDVKGVSEAILAKNEGRIVLE